MTIILCSLSLFIGFIIGISFYAPCKNELDLERLKHRMTMDALVNLRTQIENENEKIFAGGK